MILALLSLAALASDFPARAGEAIRAHVSAARGMPAADVEVLSPGLAAAGCPGGGEEIEVQARPGEDYTGDVSLLVVASQAGVRCGQWRVHPRLRLWAELPVAAAAAAPGEPVRVGAARVSLDSVPGTPIDPAGGPWLARAPLRAGEPLTRERLAPAPDAAPGADVKIEIRSGSLVIEAPGRLLQGGRVGEAVQVHCLATGAALQGRLASANRVIVED